MSALDRYGESDPRRENARLAPGAGYSQALDKLYGNNGQHFPRRSGNCKRYGLQPIGFFLYLALTDIEAQAAKRTPQRRAA